MVLFMVFDWEVSRINYTEILINDNVIRNKSIEEEEYINGSKKSTVVATGVSVSRNLHICW